MKTTLTFLTSIFSAILLSGCMNSYDQMAGGGLTPEQASLLEFSQGYELPSQSISPSKNNDEEISVIISAMQGIAGQQGLVFDGSKANEGFVAVGKQGNTDKMVVILKLYRASNGRIAFQDTHFWKGSDMSQGMRMRDKFLSALQ